MRLAAFLTTLLIACRAFGGAYSLTDGSFNGWEGDTKSTWRIEEGAFTAGSVEKNQPRNEFLCTKKEFGDFDLTLKWKLIGTEGFVNGGVQFRTKRIPNHHEVSGYQADLGAGYDGALYDESRRNKMLAQPAKEVLEKARKPLGEWNTYRIRAEGARIQIWLNGVQTVDYTEEQKDIPRTGVIAVQIHGDAKSQVWYKEIIIEELGGNKPAAEPKGPTARFADPLPAPPREPFKDGKFEIRPGEVIVFTGGTNMVRLVENGWFEASLAMAAKEQKPRFRNMAWDGDTVYEQWRDMNFGSWKEQLDAVNATCVFLWFGQMEALDETRDDAAFEQAAAKLMDEFKVVTPRLVVMTPMEFNAFPRIADQAPDAADGWPDNTAKNERILRLGGILKKLAQDRGVVLLDWPSLESRLGDVPLPRTINGVHLSDHAVSFAFSNMLLKALGLPEQKDHGSGWLYFIQTKNRLWHDCWKTMNWAFAYSDRTEQPFGKGIGEHPPMAKELEKYKPLLREADERIHALALGQTPPPVQEKPAPPKPQPQSPDVEKASFKVRDGFDVNLFASEADGLVKPLSMRWDERGRLWAACSPSYPQLVPGEPHGDYILVCEDTNADGKADKFHKFADGLTMPMGIEFAADGGVYVCESTQLALFRDTNGDGVSDSREVVLSGFGTGDSHQMINSLRWGPDGCLWFSQGLHIFSRIETPHGIVRFDRAGLWRFDPRTWKLQGFFGNAAAGANCWGVTFDDWGQVFHCAADNTPGFYTTPGLGTWPNPPPYYNIGALAVSPVKGMCLEYIQSTHLPPDLQGVLCKPVYFANQLLLYKLVEDGSGYKTEDLGPLLTSSINAFRPLGVQTGPDGALYICDWYNPVIGHYQASYRDPNRDKIHGRIWRVSAKGRGLVEKPNFGKMEPVTLAAQLHSPERWVRDQTKRLLAAMNAKDLEDCLFLTAEDEQASYYYEVLGVYAMRGEIPGELQLKCLSNQDARLRAFAVRLWSQHTNTPGEGQPDEENDFIKRIANAVNDASPRVRLEAVIGASYFKSPEAVEVALGVLDHPRDRFIDYALANTIRATKPVWQPALEAGAMTFSGNVAHLAFLLQTDGQADTASALQKIIAGGKVPEESLEALRVLLIGSGDPEQLATAIKAGPMTGDIAGALVDAMKQRGVRPAGDFSQDFAVWEKESGSEVLAVALCRLALAWGMPDKAARLPELTKSDRATVAAAAIAALVEWKGRDALPELEALSRSEPATTAVTALAEIVKLDPAKGAAFSAEKIVTGLSAEGAGVLLQAALMVSDGPAQLAAAFARSAPPAATALELLKTLATAGRSEPALAAVLRKAAGLPENASVVPDYSAKFVAKLITDAKASGDAARGRDVFMAAQSACIGCHKVGDEGGVTGPNLTAAGRGMTPELLTESVLWPRRQIKEGYFLSTVTTHEGKVFSGYKVSEDVKTLTLRQPGSESVESLVKDKIKDRSDTGTLMPDGLTAWMTEQQRLDLLRYLFELGK
jgi:putative heme-binding domain-containing protein